MRKTGFILSMALFLIFSSCEKDDKKPEVVPGDQITKLEYSNEEYTRFEYNAEKLISKISFAADGEQNNVIITYDEQKRIKEVEGGDGYTYLFSYENGKLSSADIHVQGEGHIGVNEYFYDAGGQLKSVTTFMKDDNNNFVPFIKVSYEFTADNKGNISKQTYRLFDEATDEFQVTKILEYSNYDNKINPLKDFGDLAFLLFNHKSNNNPGKLVEKEADGTVISTSTFAYTYNSKGRPSQSIETIDEGGTVETHTVKFTY